MIGLFTAAWQSTDLSRTMMACVDAGREELQDTDQQFADRLGVAPSRIAAMRSGLDAGPGFLRFASLPVNFWIGFGRQWFALFCIRIITDHELERQIAWLNFWMVRTMRRDAARLYPGEDFADTPEIPVDDDERRRA